MRWLPQLRMQIKMLFQRCKASAQLDDELRFHLEEQIAENIAAGMSAEEARYAALRSFGNPTLLREQTRAVWSWMWLESLVRDVRYAARTLIRTPGFTTIAILVMALGIGSNIAMFTVVRSVLLKPLPYPDAARLMKVYESQVVDDDKSQMNPVAGGVYSEWKRQNHTFEDLALAGPEEVNLSGTDALLSEKIHGVNCTWNLLPLLGVQPALGHNFTAADDQYSANGTVLLSWELWKRRFGGDSGILNKTIHLNTQSYTVIGILPAGFAFPGDPSVQLLTPVNRDKPVDRMESFGDHEFEVLGRLKPSMTAEEGKADLSVISRTVHDQHTDTPIGKSANLQSLLDDMVGGVRKPLYMLLAATVCMLLIACLNVANLLIARGAARRKEQAIRMALGGSRMRLLRTQMMDSLLLTFAGGAGGIALAYAALQWLARTRSDLSRVETIQIDGIVAVFALGVILLCALFCGLIGALSSRDTRLLASLQEVSRSSSSGVGRVQLRRGLLTLEVGLTVVLLVAAGLLLKSYQRLRSSEMGCITQNVLTMRIGLFGGHYNDPALQVNFYSDLLTRVRALPGVDATGFVQAVPGQGYWGDNLFTVVEHPPLPPGQVQFAIYRWADPGYFSAMGIPVLRGHSFDSSKRLDHADEIVISKSFADENLSGEDPIGKHLRVDDRVLTIVGVVGDTRYIPAEDPKPMMYVPLFRGFANNGTLVIRSSHDVDQLALPVQRIVQALDHDLAVSDVLTMDQLLGKTTVDASFDATLLGFFAGLSLLLAAVGLFGVLSYIVAQRTSEIGIRIALGAQREQVLRLVLLDGLRPALAGLAFGLTASACAARPIRSMLYGTRPLDPAVFTAAAATLFAVALVACAVPAWRASRLDPVTALRME